MKELEKMFTLVMCLALTMMWAAYERSQGIEIFDQVFMACVFSAAIIHRIYKK